MKSGEEFKKALGAPDQAFIDRVHQTLANLPEKKEVKVKKVYRSVVLIAAIVGVMTIAMAEGNVLGIRDFFNMWFGNGVSFDQKTLSDVRSSITLTGDDMALAEVQVKEAYYDGVNLFVVAEMASRQEDTLFINQFDNDPSFSMTFMGENGELVKTGLTVREYAEKNGYARCLSASIDLDTEMEVDDYVGEMMNIPGGIIAALSFSGLNGQEEIPITLTATLMTMPEEEGMECVEQARYSFTVHRMGTDGAQYENGAVAEYPSCGVRMDSVQIRTASLGCFVQMTYTVVDEEAYNTVGNGLWFELLDEDGEPLKCMFGGESWRISDTQFTQVERYLFPEAGSSLTVRAYDCWEKRRFETNVIPMQPTE